MLRDAGRVALAETFAAGTALALLVSSVQAQPAPAAKGQGTEVGMSMDPSQGPFVNRGGSLPPIIGILQGEGVKFVSIGDEGAKGYLGEAANGRFQTVYVSPDGQNVVAGLMFRSGGANVTSRQVGQMMRRFTDAARVTQDGAALPEIPADDEQVPDSGKPFVDWMRESGMKLTPFLDREGGLDGYLVESPGKDGKPGKMQPFYVMPDGRHAVAGVLVRKGGVLVTGLQIAALQQRYLQDVEAKNQEQASVIDPNSPNPPPVPPQSLVHPAASTPAPTAPVPAPEPAVPAETVTEPAPAATPAAPVRPAPRAEAPAAPGPEQTVPSVSGLPESAAKDYLVPASDQKGFLAAAKNTVWFPVGMRTAPVVWMVADPQCPFCHEAWRQMKPLVFSGKLQVRVILIAGLSGSDPLARSILSRGEPTGADAGRAWLEGEGSIANVAIKAPPADGVPSNEAARRFVAYNSDFARQYKITRTPFLFYEASGERLFASIGMPASLDAFLAAAR